jgi:hypothetical protein
MSIVNIRILYAIIKYLDINLIIIMLYNNKDVKKEENKKITKKDVKIY